MRVLWILVALTGSAAAEAVARAPQQAAPPPVAPPPASAHRSSPQPVAKQLLPILLEDTWHYLNPDPLTSTWEFADVTFTPAGVLLITEHTMSADLVLRRDLARDRCLAYLDRATLRARPRALHARPAARPHERARPAASFTSWTSSLR